MITKNLTASELKGAVWRKSSYSGGSEGQCVEVADLTATPVNAVGFRDSKSQNGPAVLIPRAAAESFFADVQAGRYDI